MPAHFEVGEIAILVQDRTITKEAYLRYDFEECEILESLGEHKVRPNEVYTEEFMYGYTVLLRDGKVLVCRPHELRKKKRPNDESWANNKVAHLLQNIRSSIRQPELME